MIHDATAQRGDAPEFRSGGRLLLAAMLGTGLGFPSVAFYTVGIFAPILAKEFGWSFGSILGGLALTPVVLLIGGPFTGYLVDRYGARKIASLSLAGLGISYITLAFSSGSIAQYYASWMALSVTGLGATPISFTRAVNGAFVKRRGLALGITLAGIGLFALAVKPLGAWLLDVAGWRGAVVTIGLLPLMIGVPVVLWGFPVARANGAAGSAPLSEVALTGLTVREALHSRAFWILILAFVPMGFAIGAPLPNLENILRSGRIDAKDIAALASLIGIALIAGRLIGGWLIDRMWAPLVGAIILLGGAIGCWTFSQEAMSRHEAMLAIALLGFAGGAEVDLLSYLVARYIGVRNYGVLYGTIFGLFAVGAGAGPGLLGHAYDRAGNYVQIMQTCALMLLLTAGLLLALGRYPNHLSSR